MVHAVIYNPQCPTSVQDSSLCLQCSHKPEKQVVIYDFLKETKKIVPLYSQTKDWLEAYSACFSKTNLPCRSRFPLGFINYHCLYQSLLLSYFSVSLRRTKIHFFQDFFLFQFSLTLIVALAFYLSPCLFLLFCLYLFFAPDSFILYFPPS